MNYPTTIKCTNGSIARLESHEKWYIPTSVGGYKYDHEVDWTLYPERHRDRLRTLSEELLMVIHPRTFVNATHALVWVFKYLSYLEAEDKYFDELTQVEWAGFDEFLMRNSLKLNSRRAYVSYLKTVLRTASNKRVDGIQPASLERITRGTKRRFRDANKLSMEKSSKRALSDVQLTAYGYCPLEEDSESCDLGDPAWIGPSNDPTYVQHNEESTIKSDIVILTKQQSIWDEDSTKKGSFKENVRGTL